MPKNFGIDIQKGFNLFCILLKPFFKTINDNWIALLEKQMSLTIKLIKKTDSGISSDVVDKAE